LNVEGKVKVKRQVENEKKRKKAELRRDFGLVNSKTQAIWKNKTKITGALKQNESRISDFPHYFSFFQSLLPITLHAFGSLNPFCTVNHIART
jgi:hypothetical protein